MKCSGSGYRRRAPMGRVSSPDTLSSRAAHPQPSFPVEIRATTSTRAFWHYRCITGGHRGFDGWSDAMPVRKGHAILVWGGECSRRSGIRGPEGERGVMVFPSHDSRSSSGSGFDSRRGRGPWSRPRSPFAIRSSGHRLGRLYPSGVTTWIVSSSSHPLNRSGSPRTKLRCSKPTMR